ncbi:Aspartate 1-decarboxylase [Anaerovibrio sp. JC8]|uniref:aspartate 1-decarboxylase n=1 Tax=Anaerovibrio sp. JC8 TaxID=1240085 RepID=UPI000A0A3F6F|nr:aspartate 1-decarboxylase [Anaerovibrio sp. JC8]ORT99248.1 Aspartate 1-decarboxylase [Anaerovibrio sp. JC8]
MMLHMLKSKLHCATVTEANLQYMGSITIDSDLMKAAGIYENERVQVVNNNNGSRLETYVIPGKPGSGVICLNGSAARWAQPGDVVIIMAYAFMEEREAVQYRPTVVMLDNGNKVKEIRNYECHGEIYVNK